LQQQVIMKHAYKVLQVVHATIQRFLERYWTYNCPSINRVIQSAFSILSHYTSQFPFLADLRRVRVPRFRWWRWRSVRPEKETEESTAVAVTVTGPAVAPRWRLRAVLKEELEQPTAAVAIHLRCRRLLWWRTIRRML
jgi:hypothetical protein